jgi:3,4-dihydroxy 2-butanone 4-phosphate synthase/GTP cyclohydrolase II
MSSSHDSATAYAHRATASVRRTLERFAAGTPVVVADRTTDDGAGLVLIPAQLATADRLRTLTDVARGAVYLALADDQCRRLDLDLIAARDDSMRRPPRTVTISAREGIDTGVSLEEHARTIRVAIDPGSTARDIVSGGHVHPLRARPGGVLERAGWTEAGVDLARLAGLDPSAVLAEIRLDDGTEPRGGELVDFAERRGLPLITIGEVIAYRRCHERLVERVAEAELPTVAGTYRAIGYADVLDGREHLALVRGDVAGREDVLVYLHLACWEGDVFRSVRCDCRARLDAATRAVSAAGQGVIVHLAPEGRDRHNARDPGAHLRDFGVGAQILADQGLASLCVLSDNPRPLPGLEGFGLTISGYAPLLTAGGRAAASA